MEGIKSETISHHHHCKVNFISTSQYPMRCTSQTMANARIYLEISSGKAKLAVTRSKS